MLSRRGHTRHTRHISEVRRFQISQNQDVVRLNRDGLQRSQDQDRALGQTKRDALIDHVLNWRQNQARTRTM